MEEIIITYLDSDEEVTPVQEVDQDLLVEDMSEEETPVTIHWWDGPMEELITKLTDVGIRTTVTYDYRLEPELMLHWHSHLAHIQAVFGYKDDPERSKFGSYTFIVEGVGKIMKSLTYFDQKAMDDIFFDAIVFKRMIDRLTPTKPLTA